MQHEAQTPIPPAAVEAAPRFSVGAYVNFSGLPTETGRIEYVSCQAEDGEQCYSVSVILRESQLTALAKREVSRG